MKTNLLSWLLIAAGAGQIGLAAASLCIPHLLNWKQELARVSPLTRHVFWTYAGYILAFNLSFGVLSILGPALLLDQSPLAAVVAGFIAVYWTVRLLLQLGAFGAEKPPGLWFRLGEGALVALFLFLGTTYGLVMIHNLSK